MNHNEAKQQLQHALKNQQTISINKLKNLMQALNMSLEPSKDKEVRYLKGEIKSLRKHIRKLKG